MRTRVVDGTKIRRRREELGLKVTQLAAEARCSKWHIYGIEKGRHQPAADVYAAIRAALRIPDEDHDLLLVDAEPEGSGDAAR